MRQTKYRRAVRGFIAGIALVAFFILSNLIAPTVAGYADLNHYNFLSWGAPGLFHEEIDTAGALARLEPWRILGLQLPVLAGISPNDWSEPVIPPFEDNNNLPAFPDNPPYSGSGIVGIYHSHASEAFIPTSGAARSTDFSETVVELGRIITGILEGTGIKVVHNQEYHDQVYSQSYVSSRRGVVEMLVEEPTISVLFDLHRDGIGETATAGRSVTTTQINGKASGKIMFVISSAHSNWQKNHRIANDLHNLLENKYPGLSRGILIRSNSTYNQDLHTGAILIEIGGHWNSYDEAQYGAELFAEILADYIGGSQ